LLCQEGEHLDDGDSRSPVFLVGQLCDGREDALGQGLDADDFVQVHDLFEYCYPYF